jgi:uncharacterized tellurite resistance protein B-like protein
MNIDELDAPTRKRLVQTACVLAWADAELAPAESDFIMDLTKRLGMAEADVQEVREWLRRGPPDLDPNTIPHRHRQAFLEVVREVVGADGRIDPEESETLRLLYELLS